MGSEKERKLVGNIEIHQVEDGGFIIIYTSPHVKEGLIFKRETVMEKVAETRESLFKKVNAAVQFMMKYVPRHRFEHPTLPGAADHEET